MDLSACVVRGRHLDAPLDGDSAPGHLANLGFGAQNLSRGLARLGGRALAIALVPVLGLALLMRRLSLGSVAGRLPWTRIQVVNTRNGRTNLSLRQALPGAQGLLAHVAGPLMDVADGRRAWCGARPRNLAQWNALPDTTRLALAPLPVGCFHEPAWVDHEDDRLEAEAAADMFYAVRRGWREHLRILHHSLRRLRDTQSPVVMV
jgi:hypothetical protein